MNLILEIACPDSGILPLLPNTRLERLFAVALDGDNPAKIIFSFLICISKLL